MLVTINTDASFNHENKFGGFAFWIKSSAFKIQKAGYFKDTCLNPTEAEMKCIINALHVLLSSHNTVTRIIINTDSLNSIHIINNDRININKYGLHFGDKLRRKFIKIQKSYHRTLNIQLRHVKAHSNVNDARSYVNEWCDKHAKAYMWRKTNLNK